MTEPTTRFRVELTARQVGTVLGALVDAKLDTDRYLRGGSTAVEPRPTDTCCAAHLAQFEERRKHHDALTERLEHIQNLIAAFEALEAETVSGDTDAAKDTALEAITLVYRNEDGTRFEQPLSDIASSGTLIDPENGDDLELVSARVDALAALNDGQYEAITQVIDRVKLDERSLDTDEYAGQILDALRASADVSSDQTIPQALITALRDRASLDTEDSASARAADWLEEHQDDDEAWLPIGRLLDEITRIAAED